jgi:hypothetical protein
VCILTVKVSVQIVEKHRVKAIYLAPTAIRDMMAHDDMHVRRHDRSSLEVRKPWYSRVSAYLTILLAVCKRKGFSRVRVLRHLMHADSGICG